MSLGMSQSLDSIIFNVDLLAHRLYWTMIMPDRKNWAKTRSGTKFKNCSLIHRRGGNREKDLGS